VRAFIWGVIFGFILIAAGVYFYFTTGMAPVAASARAMPYETYLAKKALHARVEKEMPKTVPLQPNEANYLAGAHLYRGNCAVCHGLPNQPATAIAKGEFPKPPELVSGKGVTDDPPGETYWKVANGIRLTGMPAFDQSLSTDQMWQVSLMLANADKLPASVHAVLSAPMPSDLPAAQVAPPSAPVQTNKPMRRR
jgi:thiosulfate dehydrogenase